MRKSFAAVLVAILAVSSPVSMFAQGQGAVTGVAQSADKAPLPNFRIHVRNANTGELAGSTTSNQAGQFSFSALTPGNYVVEIVDAAGKVVGLSSSLTVTAGSTVTVTVGATAAGALAAAGGGGLSLLGMGPLASVAVAGAASAAAVTAVVATRDGSILICQTVGGVATTVEVKESEREAKLAAGATLGACPASPSR